MAIIIGLIQIFLAIMAIMVAILIPLIGFTYWRNRKLKAQYAIIWTKSWDLQPRDVLGIRGEPAYGFREYYYERPTDLIIRENLATSQSLLIIGHPLAGKTRALYQELINANKPFDVIIPRLVDVNTVDFRIPRRLTRWRTPVLLLDDLDKYLEKQNMTYLIQEFIRAGTMIVATCREGFELQKVGHVLEREMVLFAEPVQITKLDRDSGREIARQVGRDISAAFDGNIGSILLQLDAMKDRFQAADETEKGILRALKRLFLAGIYQEREIFSLPRLKEVCRKLEGLEMPDYQWRQTCERLRDHGFVDFRGEESLRAEEAYLEVVVQAGFQLLDNLGEMLRVFVGDPEALVAIGNKSYELALVDLQKVAYISLAIAAYEAALTVYTREHLPMQYGMTQNNLGNAFRTLAEVEDTAANCGKAIAAYEAALVVRTRERFPMDYGLTQQNLGSAYGTIARVEDKASNCRKAIAAFDAALQIRTRERFPLYFATTQTNLGAAYRIMSEVEETKANCYKAIEAFEAALEILSLERFPIDYATTQNNLGNVYVTLAEEENKAVNSKKAIGAYEAALQIRTLERMPLQYAWTQNNLGSAYGVLAEVEETAVNCAKAIGAFNEVLKVNSRERFPMDYANTQANLGNIYFRLAEVEEKSVNCQKAILALEEALHFFTPQEFPELYKIISNNHERISKFCQG